MTLHTIDRTPLDASEILLDGLPVPPSVNNLFFNVKRGRAKTDRYSAWRREAGLEIMAQRPRPLNGRVEVTITIQDGASKADADNLIKAPVDLLVELGLIDGDGPKVVRRASIGFGKDRGMRIEVRRVA